MKLCLKNIGKIGWASVEMKGITVIAGENDTGKSTVGKVLFMTEQKGNIIDEIVINKKFEDIYNKINSVCKGNIVRSRWEGLSYHLQSLSF